MRVCSKTKGAIERTLAIHDDGALSFALVGKRLVIPMRKAKKDHWTILAYDEVIKVPVIIDGVQMYPKLIVRLVAKASRKANRRSRWGDAIFQT